MHVKTDDITEVFTLSSWYEKKWIYELQWVGVLKMLKRKWPLAFLIKTSKKGNSLFASHSKLNLIKLLLSPK